MTNFVDKVALVTGAGRGIGAGIAAALVRRGAAVALVDIDEASVTSQMETLSGKGRHVQAYPGDILDKHFLAQMIDAVVAEWGRLDILVNNAGIIRDNLIENISENDWDAVLDVNLKGAYLCCQSAVPKMKAASYGKIINIVSRSWLGNVGQSNYAASKGGLVSLTRTLALELAKYQINVNGVSPGFIDTPMTRNLPAKVRERLIAMQPGGVVGTVEDVAAAVCFLASDESRFINGQILHVDGGKSCGILSL